MLSLLKLESLRKKLDCGRQTIYDRLDPKNSRHDPFFPHPLKFGRSVVWIEAEIDAYIERLASSRTPTTVSGEQ